VIVAVRDESPQILTVDTAGGLAVPTGPLDPGGDPTLELAMRRYISDQTGLEVGYVEQLYTFGDRDRVARSVEGREISVAYLALVTEQQPAQGAQWTPWYDLFPWEDHRAGSPEIIERVIRPSLDEWAGDDASRKRRVALTFAADGTPWDGIRVLERYELMFEAGLAGEVAGTSDATPGLAMAWDHRRIAATALGRLRGKLTYRPVVFELMPDVFTLRHLQRTVESLVGVRLHTQNFRRLVERGRLVTGTGAHTSTGGRPAELFRFRAEVQYERPRPGLGLPYR
jgi:hypothetical protein